MNPTEQNDPTAVQRKADHIQMAFKAQVDLAHADERFYYEPLMSRQPLEGEALPLKFAGRTLKYPLWVSSMTGGTEMAKKINANLARACNEFGFGMGLGSCRSLLFSDERLEDFAMRQIIGPDMPLYANLGIAQVEELVQAGKLSEIDNLIAKLQADGLIIHVNPLQEWTQPEGDHIGRAPIDTIRDVVQNTSVSLIVKEVGQGMGPASLRALLELPIEAIELAAHGGTNFTKLELLRASGQEGEAYAQLAMVGHSAGEMVGFLNALTEELGERRKCGQIIISGGLKGFLDGYYLMNKLNLTSVYGHASMFLKYAMEDYEQLQRFTHHQIEGLKLAYSCLKVK